MPAFAETRWTLIARAQGEGSESRRALDELCRIYWSSVYAYILWSNHDADAARDLTQGFFLRFLERDLVRRVDPKRGRFQNFLKAAIGQYLADTTERARAGKRGGGILPLSLDVEDAEQRLGPHLACAPTADNMFNRAFAEAMLRRVMERLGAEHNDRPDRVRRFTALRGLLTAATDDSHAEVGARIGLSAGAVKVAVHRLRERFGELLRLEVAETLAEGEDVDAELRELLTAFEENR